MPLNKFESTNALRVFGRVCCGFESVANPYAELPNRLTNSVVKSVVAATYGDAPFVLPDSVMRNVRGEK